MIRSDSTKQTVDVQYVLEDENGHTDDIAAMTSCKRSELKESFVATGGEDGWVMLWRIQEGSVPEDRAAWEPCATTELDRAVENVRQSV